MGARIAAAVFSAIALVGGDSRAEIFNVGSDTIVFDLEPQFCLLKAQESDFDRFLIQTQINVNRGLNTFLGMFVECEKLKAYRQQNDVALGEYGILLAVGRDQPPKKIPGYSRQRFLAAGREKAGAINLDASDLQSRLYAFNLLHLDGHDLRQRN